MPEDREFQHGINNFLPIKEISRVDGNIVIVFLSGNGIQSLTPHDDGWYRTTTPSQNMSSPFAAGQVRGYAFDEAASVLGCLQQWQWCNPAHPGTSGCGPLASSLDAISGALPFFNLTKEQTITKNRERANLHARTGAHFLWSVLMQNIHLDGILNMIAYLGMGSLSSQSSVFGGIQLTLHENQWQLDVNRWWDIMLATYQSAFVETAIGEADPQVRSTLIVPSNEYERQACKSQVC